VAALFLTLILIRFQTSGLGQEKKKKNMKKKKKERDALSP